jgi:hypothetical protein
MLSFFCSVRDPESEKQCRIRGKAPMVLCRISSKTGMFQGLIMYPFFGFT